MSRTVDVVIQDKNAAAQFSQVESLIFKGLAAGPVKVTLGRPDDTRTTDQNRKLWPMLTDVSRQVEWYGQYLLPEEWKDVMTCALKRQKVVPGIDGGFIMIGGRTSKMSKKEFADLVELIYSFGAEHNVRWSEPALQAYAAYSEAA